MLRLFRVTPLSPWMIGVLCTDSVRLPFAVTFSILTGASLWRRKRRNQR
ncbi:hypothetical protein ABIE58_001196 [Roseovarius sp. MBR-78]|jgi:hypothetical protein